MEIWIYINGGAQGPFGLGDLPIESMTPDTPVWHEGLTDWTTAEKVSEIAELLMPGEDPSAGETAAQANVEIVEETIEETAIEEAVEPEPPSEASPSEADEQPAPADEQPEQPAWPPQGQQEWRPQPPRQQPDPQQPYGPQPYDQQPYQTYDGYQQPYQPYQQYPYQAQPPYGPQPYQQPYGWQPPYPQQPQPGYEGGGPGAPKAPSMWLWASIPLTIIFYGNLFGIAAIIVGIISRIKYGQGKYEAARKLSTACEWLIMIGITCGFAMLPFTMFL